MPFETSRKKIRNLADDVNLDFYKPKKVLAKYGYSQLRLANQLGISPASVSGIINGNPSIAQVMVLADAIGCSFFEFFDCPIDKKEQELRDRFMDAQANNPAVQLENVIDLVTSMRETVMMSIVDTQSMFNALRSENQNLQKMLGLVISDNEKFRMKMDSAIKLSLSSLESMNSLVLSDDTEDTKSSDNIEKAKNQQRHRKGKKPETVS